MNKIRTPPIPKWCIGFAVFLFNWQTCFGTDLGRHGAVFPIYEKDGKEQLKDAVRNKLSNGGKEQILNQAQQRTVAYYSNLPPLVNIYPATKNKVRLEDLTIVIDKNIMDTKGQVVAAAGTRINPLKIHPLTKKIYFVDARDRRQLDLVLRTAGSRDKIILTAGSVFGAQEYLKRPIFIDHNPAGILASRMRIRAVPSIVSQEDFKLKIEEVKI
jgi:conjugal transfer pilus assembly protein TraW